MGKFKKVISFCLALALMISLLPGTALAADEHWAADVVNQLNAAYGNGVFTADDDSVSTEDANDLFSNTLKFDADIYFNAEDTVPITRLQLCKAAWNMSGLALPEGTASVTFSDCEDTDVASLAAIGVVSGTGGGTFTPDGAVSNAELAVVVYRTLNKMGGIKVGKAMLDAGEERIGFNDVFPSDWFYDGIMYLYYNKIVQGVPGGDFIPDGFINNAQLTALLVRTQVALEGMDPLIDNPVDDEFDALDSGGDTWETYSPKTYFSDFDDLDAFNTSFSSIFTGDFNGNEWSKPNFWVNKDFFLVGQATSNIDPSANATRETLAFIATMLYDGYNSDDVNTSILDRFIDADDIGEAYRPAMAYLVSIGALRGNENNELLPQAIIDRATTGVFWARVLQGLDKSKMKDYQDAVDYVKNEEVGE